MFTKEEIRLMEAGIEDKKKAIARIESMGFDITAYQSDVEILTSILEKMKVEG